MIDIVAISDLHGNLPEIPKADLLLICGDIMPLKIQRRHDLSRKWLFEEFFPYLMKQPVDMCVFIGGNHDFYLGSLGKSGADTINYEIANNGWAFKIRYLCASSFEYKGVKIYGCPWCINLHNWAFFTADPERDYETIEDCDILLTHQPPRVEKFGCSYIGTKNESDYGSDDLRDVVWKRNIGLHLFGHVHSGQHNPEMFVIHNERTSADGRTTTLCNVSLLDEDYRMTYDITTFKYDASKGAVCHYGTEPSRLSLYV